MENDVINYIQEMIQELSGRLYPVMIVDPEYDINIAYTYTDVSCDHLSQSQLTLKIVCGDYDSGMSVHERIQEVLAMEEDDPFRVYGSTRFRSQLSAGGGRLFNEELQKWELSKYYILNWRNITHEKKER